MTLNEALGTITVSNGLVELPITVEKEGRYYTITFQKKKVTLSEIHKNTPMFTILYDFFFHKFHRKMLLPIEGEPPLEDKTPAVDLDKLLAKHNMSRSKFRINSGDKFSHASVQRYANGQGDVSAIVVRSIELELNEQGLLPDEVYFEINRRRSQDYKARWEESKNYHLITFKGGVS